MVWYSHLFQKFPQFIVIHTVEGFSIVNKAEIDLRCQIYVHGAVCNIPFLMSAEPVAIASVSFLALVIFVFSIFSFDFPIFSIKCD